MADKKISQLPLGKLTPNSLLPIISNGATSKVTFTEVLNPAIANDIFITAGTYNQSVGISSFYLNNGISFNITGYFTGYTYTPEDTGNKQNNMAIDGSGFKYPTVDAVNELANNIALATINTGFIDPNDTFIMARVDDNTLSFSASNRGVIFKSLLETSLVPSDAILQIPNAIIPLSGFGLTGDGIYIIFIGFTDDEEITLSNTNFNTSNNVAQLGILILKVDTGITSFLDSTRGIINKPNIANYSNLEKTILGLKSNVIIVPNSGTTTINNTSGSIKGISVNWNGTNNDEKLISSSNPTLFTHLSQANALTPTPPVFTTGVTTDQYWNGSSLVFLSTSSAATIQRWIVTINGTLALQYGEQEYPDLNTAIDNFSIATFIDIIPVDTYVEIARMAAISSATDLGDNQQVRFRSVIGVGSGGETNETTWGMITGNINDQKDLFTKFEPIHNINFVDLGNSQLPTTNINLNLGKNFKLAITGDTFLNIIPSSEGVESDLIIKINGGVSSNVTFSQNIIWDNNNIPNLTNPDGGKDTTFNVGTGPTNSPVRVILQDNNGKIFLGGDFTTFAGVSTRSLVKLNSNGTKDTTFATGNLFTSTINSIVLQPDGKIICGGQFAGYSSITANRLIRLNSGGTFDSSFSGVSGVGFNSLITSIGLQLDGKIVVVGDFTSYSGVQLNRIARLNADSTIDNAFNGFSGFNGQVTNVALQSGDSKILVGGNFTQYSGITQNYITRLNTDGSRDISFSGITGTGFNNAVIIITLQPDNKILVGGQFASYNSLLINRYAKINLDGSLDTSFNIGTGFNNQVSVSVQQLDNKLVLGGGFTQYSGVTANYLIRLNTDGSVDNSFNIGTGFNNNVNAMVLQSGDSKIIVGGAFTQYSGVTAKYLIRLNPDGSLDNTFNIGTGFNNTINSIVLQPDGKILCGGTFTTFSGITANRLIRLNSGGTFDSSFNIGTGFNTTVYGITQQLDGKILVGGDFITYSGVTANRLIRLASDGTIDTSFSVGAGFGAFVSNIIQQPDGKLLCGGNFTTFQGNTQNYLVRLNIDGSFDGTFNIGTGFNGGISRMILQPDGKLLAGGGFNSFNGIGQNYFIRLNSNGSRDTTFPNVGTPNFTVNTILLSQSQTSIFIGGSFTIYGGTITNKIARLNSDGSLDSTFNTGTGIGGSSVNTITIQPSGKLLIGGSFTAYQDVLQNNIIRLNSDGSKDNSFIVGTGPNNIVYNISLQSDGKILAGGNFTQYNGISTIRAIRLNPSIEKDFYFKLLQDGPNIIIK